MPSMFCANCACELPAIARFCVRCGSRVGTTEASVLPPVAPQAHEAINIRIAHCPKCGAQNPGDFLFCTSCGSSLGPISPPMEEQQGANEGARSQPADSLTIAHSESFPEYLPQAPDGEHWNDRKAVFLDSNEASPRVSVIGNILVMSPNSVLPPFCVKCGNRPVDPWTKITFSWHHPGYYFFLISPIIYVIVALIARKRLKVAIPLCQPHKAIRRTQLWIAAVLLLGCIPLPVAFASYVNNEAADGLAAILGLCMFIVGLFLLFFASPLRPTSISSSSAHLKGACPEFLAKVSSTT